MLDFTEGAEGVNFTESQSSRLFKDGHQSALRKETVSFSLRSVNNGPMMVSPSHLIAHLFIN